MNDQVNEEVRAKVASKARLLEQLEQLDQTLQEARSIARRLPETKREERDRVWEEGRWKFWRR